MLQIIDNSLHLVLVVAIIIFSVLHTRQLRDIAHRGIYLLHIIFPKLSQCFVNCNDIYLGNSTLLIEKTLFSQVVLVIQQDAVRPLATLLKFRVAASAPGFLDIGFQRARRIKVNDKAEPPNIDAHTKSVGSDNDAMLIVTGKGAVDISEHLIRLLPMIGQDTQSSKTWVGAQDTSKFVNGRGIRAVNNAALPQSLLAAIY